MNIIQAEQILATHAEMVKWLKEIAERQEQILAGQKATDERVEALAEQVDEAVTRFEVAAQDMVSNMAANDGGY